VIPQESFVPEPTVDAFFYGLFMDEAVLIEADVVPRKPRKAVVSGYRLHLGERATMVPEFGSQVFGMLFAITHAELHRLYSGPGLQAYRPQPVLAQLLDGSACAASAYNLVTPPEQTQPNRAYAEKLRSALTRLGFPDGYVNSIS
jgi:hypothetical protein